MSFQSSPTWSARKLGLLFAMALLLFMFIRWDSSVWLQQRLNQIIAEQQLNISYGSAHLQGFTLHIDEVRITTPQHPQPFPLQSLTLNLNWMSLLQGELSLHAHASNAFMDLNADVTQHDTLLQLRAIEGFADVALAQTWLALPSPVKMQGQLQLQGSAALMLHNGFPTQADLTAHWLKGAANMMMLHYPLGEYALHATLQENLAQWTLSGGEQLTLNGQGELHLQPTMPAQQWAISGSIRMQAAEGSPLASFLTSQEKLAQISGTIGLPLWQM